MDESTKNSLSDGGLKHLKCDLNPSLKMCSFSLSMLRPLLAEVSITLTPNSRSRRSVFITMPFFAAMSVMLRTSETGIPKSETCVKSNKLRLRFDESITTTT